MALSYVPLYAGPVLTGLACLTAWSIPAFGLIFAALVLYARPGQSAVAACVTVALNIAIAGLLYAAGLGLSYLTGPVEGLLWMTLGLSALSAVWLAHRYRNLAQMDAALDDALTGMKAEFADWEDVLADGGAPQRLLAALEHGREVAPEDLPGILNALNAADPRVLARDVARHADMHANGLRVALAWFAQDIVPRDLLSGPELEDLLEDAAQAGWEAEAAPLAARFATR